MSSDPCNQVNGLRDEGIAWLIGAQYACWLHTVGPIVRQRGLCAATSLRHGTTVNASQLPLPRQYSALQQFVCDSVTLIVVLHFIFSFFTYFLSREHHPQYGSRAERQSSQDEQREQFATGIRTTCAKIQHLKSNTHLTTSTPGQLGQAGTGMTNHSVL